MTGIEIANDVGSKEFAGAIRQRVTAPVRVVEMAAGDFRFEGCGPRGKLLIGIERKAIGDMISSMRSNRYAGFQAPNMNLDFDVCYVLVEGLWKPDKNGLLCVPIKQGGKTRWIPYRQSMTTKVREHSSPYMYSELDKHLCTMELQKHVMYVRSMSQLETVWQVINRFQWWQKPWDDHASGDPIKLQAEVSFQHFSLCRKLASVLPGIGWQKSGPIAGYFAIRATDDVSAGELMLASSLKEWQQITDSKGQRVVGPSLAAKLHAAIRSRK